MGKAERLAFTFTQEHLQRWKDRGVKIVYAVIENSPDKTILLHPEFKPEKGSVSKTLGINDQRLVEYSKGAPKDYSISALP